MGWVPGRSCPCQISLFTGYGLDTKVLLDGFISTLIGVRLLNSHLASLKAKAALNSFKTFSNSVAYSKFKA
eukprot:snap_masked-scaffold_56-processed-gene-0.31-mRNA-1 protein AED:1.00 eAED:1.00 QI:0/0/0/0/1/1/2/0/70